MPRVKRSLSPQEEETALEIRRYYGGMLDLTKIMELLGNVSRHTAEKWVTDVDAINVNGRKKYLPADLARKIEAQRARGECQ